jgi:hypothetical protein
MLILRTDAGLALLALCCMVGGAVGVAVMSVDIGSEWMKVAVVSVSNICVDRVHIAQCALHIVHFTWCAVHLISLFSIDNCISREAPDTGLAEYPANLKA